MNRTWLVTGTDTNAGKTHVTCALLRAGRTMLTRVGGYKPVESGCPAGQAHGLDAIALANAAGTAPQCSYAFPDAVAPWLAARNLGQEIVLPRIVARATELQHENELLFIEGAGGFLVPLTAGKTIADLAIALQAPVLIVAPDLLGTVNHTLLTIEAVRSRGLQVAAVILTELALGDGLGLENAEQIAAHGQVKVHYLRHAAHGLATLALPILTALLANTES